jgi:hypothetical protein
MDADMLRTVVERVDLGAGLSHAQIAYTYQESLTSPIEVMGVCEAYIMRLVDGEITIEMDDNLDFHRKVSIWFPNGTHDGGNSAKQLLQLATLLTHGDVLAALARWAAEDASVIDA